jgi:hypothetical protein
LKFNSANAAAKGVELDANLNMTWLASNLRRANAFGPVDVLAFQPWPKSRGEPRIDDIIWNAKDPTRLIRANALKGLLHPKFHSLRLFAEGDVASLGGRVPRWCKARGEPGTSTKGEQDEQREQHKREAATGHTVA